MKIIFHIGMPKTGTTSLQYYLFKNKNNLMPNGFIYEPEIFTNQENSLGSTNHNDFGMNIINNPDKTIHTLLDRLKFHDNKSNYYIISAEVAVVYFSEKHIKFLYDNLHEHDIEIVLYIRRQDDFIESFYKTCIQCGMCFSIDEAIKLCNPDYDDIVKKWKQNKNIKVHVVKYKSSKTIKNFFDIYGMKIDDDLSEYKLNLSLGTNHIEIVSLIKRNTNILFNFLEPEMFIQGLQAPKSYRIFSLAERKNIMKNYEQSNNTISKQFFDGEPLFEPLPETDSDSIGHTLLDSDEIIKILEKYILYCVKSNKHINNLIKYIDNSGDFDEVFYRKKYLCGRKEIYKPIEHFARFGMYNKLLPNEDFDADKIYNLYPELKNTGIPPYILYTVLKIIKNKETSD